MDTDEESKLATRLREKRTILIAAAAVVLFVIVFIFLVTFFGMQVGDPRGKAPGPGP